MGNKRVFIGWNGLDNREIAQRVSNQLSAANFSPIVGGEWRASLTVSEEIIHQMNGCDFAIILIEKEERRNKKGELVSMGLNPNVMMELGYMLHKVTDPNRIRRILINMDPSELPSDLQGAWTVTAEKEEYDPKDETAKNAALNAVVEKVTDDFFEYMKEVQSWTDKLDYFNNWEEHVQDIYRFTGDVRIADKLIYGMQAAMYSGDFDRLYKRLTSIKDRLALNDRFGDYSAVACAMAILNVFVVTRRLTQIPDEAQFGALCEALECEYEKDIKDADLRAWCKIFRMDKLELCYEVFAEGREDDEEKKEYYEEALNLCLEILSMIDDHVNGLPDGKKRDEKYSLIYRAFASRNVSQIHKRLAELDPDSMEEHLAKQKEYCALSLENRRQLYDYYKGSIRENSLAMDYISQEYLLALAEQYKFETKKIEQGKISRTIKTIYTQWKDRNKIRNMIFEKVRAEASDILPQD